MIQDHFPVGKADNTGLYQRKTIGHIIEKIIKLIFNIENRQADISQQQYKCQCLIFKHQHQKDSQSDDKNQRRYTDQEKIKQISHPVYFSQCQVECCRNSHNNKIQQQKDTQVSPYFTYDIFSIAQRTDIKDFRCIQFFISFQKVGGQKNSYNCLSCIKQ